MPDHLATSRLFEHTLGRTSRTMCRSVLLPLMLLILLLQPYSCNAGKFIVFLDPAVSHAAFEESIHGYNALLPYTHSSHDLKVTHTYTHLAHGVAVSGSRLLESHIRSIQGVLHVAKDMRRRLPNRAGRTYAASGGWDSARRIDSMPAPPWGIDILDSEGRVDGEYCAPLISQSSSFRY